MGVTPSETPLMPYALLARAEDAQWSVPLASSSPTASISFHPGTAGEFRSSRTQWTGASTEGGSRSTRTPLLGCVVARETGSPDRQTTRGRSLASMKALTLTIAPGLKLS